ncbi:hypothetical protein BDL97_01G140300 [Sphagnum fallax]|nr:hypothetical protein BDL97_01G140300 [Sphagnum fallax]
MAARFGSRLSLGQLIIGLWRPWDGAVQRSTSFPPCQKILDDHWSPLASMNQHTEATKSNNDCHLESSDYEIADKNHLRYFRPNVNWSYLSSFRIKIQYTHHPDGHVAKACSFHTLSTEETPETESLRIQEAELPEITSFGSGIKNQPLKMNPCANHIAHVTDSLCSKPGIIVCPSCNLVSYCSDGCRMQNWEKHRSKCLSSQLDVPPPSPPKETQGLTTDVVMKGSEWLWGNVPAYGLLGNHLGNLPEHIRVCFAASGDLRNTIETVCQLPENFQGSLTVYLNDYNPKIAFRNLLMLELLRFYGFEAIDTVIALWCSVLLTANQLLVCDNAARTLLDRSLTEMKFHEMHFPGSGGSTIHAQFDKSTLWNLIPRVTVQEPPVATTTLKSCMQPQSYALNCKLGCLQPAHRVAWKEYLDHGLVLPFSADKRVHDQLNPYLHNSSVTATLADGSSPLDGWDPSSLLAAATRENLPPMDLYGHLFFHLRERLSTFISRLHSCQVHFRLSCCDASSMATKLQRSGVRLHRVDTSNIADETYQGIAGVLQDWGPLLEQDMPGVTLVTLLMNWPLHCPDSAHQISTSRLTEDDLREALVGISARTSDDPGFAKLLARGLQHGDLSLVRYFHNSSKAFLRYLDSRSADRIGKSVDIQRREAHLIVPHRLFVGMDASINATPGDTTSSDLCYYHTAVHSYTFTERYVEWEVVGMQ